MIVLIKHIVQIKTLQDHEKCVILANIYEEVERRACIASDHVVRISTDGIFHICDLTQNILACYASDIQEKMICMPYSDYYCITKLVNNIEKD